MDEFCILGLQASTHPQHNMPHMLCAEYETPPKSLAPFSLAFQFWELSFFQPLSHHSG
jgi:hypothetical protein